MRCFPLLLAASALLAACQPERGVRPGDTQVVAQWLDKPGRPNGFFAGLTRTILEDRRINNACGDVCYLDGNDVGSGTYNLFLYTQDVPQTVRRMIALEKAGQIAPGMRIGVAKYKDTKHSDWTYQPVYPSTLKKFGLIYH